MKMKWTLILIGRTIFGLGLLAFAYWHFTNAQGMANYVPLYFPNWVFWVYLTWTWLALAGLSFIINRATIVGWIGLAFMLWVFIVTIHIPALAQNPMALWNLLKDLIIASWALVIAGIDTWSKIAWKKESSRAWEKASRKTAE